jgi:LPS-assembly lipoprotein
VTVTTAVALGQARRRCFLRRTGLATAALGAVLGAGASLAGCGFALRQPPKLAFGSICVTGLDERSALGQQLRRQLALQVRVLSSPATAAVVLQVLVDAQEKSVVASTSAAQVREAQLRQRFSFRASTPGGRELLARADLLVSRDISYSETFALAKADEEAALLANMQADVVAQVLRRLAAIPA